MSVLLFIIALGCALVGVWQGALVFALLAFVWGFLRLIRI